MKQREGLLEARQLNLTIAGKAILKDIQLAVCPGEVLCVVGANGAGKSSLLKVLNGQIKAHSGQINLAGRAIAQWSDQERAQRLALLSQQFDVQLPFKVHEVIALGAYPYRKVWTKPKLAKMLATVTEYLNIAALTERDYNSLSGGEKQRVQFARVLMQIELAQGALPRVLLLDEPAAHLDIAHQQMLLKQIRQLINHRPVGVVMVLHDLNLALAYADQIILLRNGEIYQSGPPKTVLNPEHIKVALGANMQQLGQEQGGWLLPG